MAHLVTYLTIKKKGVLSAGAQLTSTFFGSLKPHLHPMGWYCPLWLPTFMDVI